jgi:uncharacterized damage-inducible protein DinB
MPPGISFSELLAWIASETTRYEAWFAQQQPTVWSAPAGTGRIATVRDLLFHTYVVDLRYGQRLRGLPVSSYEDEAVAEPMALFTLARRGQDLLAQTLDGRIDLAEVIEFQTLTAGTQRASKRKVIAHALTHHIRHMAQVATLLRQHGSPTGWPHDLLFSDALA